MPGTVQLAPDPKEELKPTVKQGAFKQYGFDRRHETTILGQSFTFTPRWLLSGPSTSGEGKDPDIFFDDDWLAKDKPFEVIKKSLFPDGLTPEQEVKVKKKYQQLVFDTKYGFQDEGDGRSFWNPADLGMGVLETGFNLAGEAIGLALLGLDAVSKGGDRLAKFTEEHDLSLRAPLRPWAVPDKEAQAQTQAAIALGVQLANAPDTKFKEKAHRVWKRVEPRTIQGKTFITSLLLPVLVAPEVAKEVDNQIWNNLPEDLPVEIRAGVAAASRVATEATMLFGGGPMANAQKTKQLSKAADEVLSKTGPDSIVIADINAKVAKADKGWGVLEVRGEEALALRESFLDAGIEVGKSERAINKMLNEWKALSRKHNLDDVSAEAIYSKAEIDARLQTVAPGSVVHVDRAGSAQALMKGAGLDIVGSAQRKATPKVNLASPKPTKPPMEVKGSKPTPTNAQEAAAMAAARLREIEGGNLARAHAEGRPFYKGQAMPVDEIVIDPSDIFKINYAWKRNPKRGPITVVEGVEGSHFFPDRYRVNAASAAKRLAEIQLAARLSKNAEAIAWAQLTAPALAESPRVTFIKQNLDTFLNGAIKRDAFEELAAAAAHAETYNRTDVLANQMQVFLRSMSKRTGLDPKKNVRWGQVAAEYGVTRDQLVDAVIEYTAALNRADPKARAAIEDLFSHLRGMERNFTRLTEPEVVRYIDGLHQRINAGSGKIAMAENKIFTAWKDLNNAARGLIVSGVNTQWRNMWTEIPAVGVQWMDGFLAAAGKAAYGFTKGTSREEIARQWADRIYLSDIYNASLSRMEAGALALGRKTGDTERLSQLVTQLQKSPTGRVHNSILSANPASEFAAGSGPMKAVTSIAQLERRLVGSWTYEIALNQLARQKGHHFRTADTNLNLFTKEELDSALTMAFRNSFAAAPTSKQMQTFIYWMQNGLGVAFSAFPRFSVGSLLPYIASRIPGLGFMPVWEQMGAVSGRNLRKSDMWDRAARQVVAAGALMSAMNMALDNPDYIQDEGGQWILNPDADGNYDLYTYPVGERDPETGAQKVADTRLVNPVNFPMTSDGSINPSFMPFHAALGRMLGRWINYGRQRPEEFALGLGATSASRNFLELTSQQLISINTRGGGSGMEFIQMLQEAHKGERELANAMLAQWTGKLIAMTAGGPLQNVDSAERFLKWAFTEDDLSKSTQARVTAWGVEHTWQDVAGQIANKALPASSKDQLGFTDPSVPAGVSDPFREALPFAADPLGSDRSPVVDNFLVDSLNPITDRIKSATAMEFHRLNISELEAFPKGKTRTETLYLKMRTGELWNERMPGILADPNYALKDSRMQRVYLLGSVLPDIREQAKKDIKYLYGGDVSTRLQVAGWIKDESTISPMTRQGFKELGFDHKGLIREYQTGKVSFEEVVDQFTEAYTGTLYMYRQ